MSFQFEIELSKFQFFCNGGLKTCNYNDAYCTSNSLGKKKFSWDDLVCVLGITSILPASIVEIC